MRGLTLPVANDSLGRHDGSCAKDQQEAVPASRVCRAGSGALFGTWSKPQHRFMNTAFDSVSDLEKQVRQIYEQAQLSQRYNQLRLGRSSLEFRQAKAEVEREVLKPWAERWNLTDPWCIDWVGTLKINSWYGDDRTDLWGSAPWAPGEVPHKIGRAHV